MRAITLTSASVYRAIIPRRTDFPTPEPANMATRWPLPKVREALMALTPKSKEFLIGLR